MAVSEPTPHSAHWSLTPLFWLSLAFLSGIILSSSLEIVTSGWLFLAAIFLTCLAINILISRLTSTNTRVSTGQVFPFWRYLNRIWVKFTSIFSRLNFPANPLLLLTVAAMGAARYQVSQTVLFPNTLAYYNDSGQLYILEGVIIKPPDYQDDQTSLVIRVDRLRPTHEYHFIDVNGLLLARVSTEKDWHYGDRIRLQGEIKTPPESENFSYRQYLARRGIHSSIEYPQVMRIGSNMGNPILGAIYGIRERAYDTIYTLFPDPEASLFAGILLGLDGSIPEPVQDAFTNTGTSHIIAISGFNITIISALLAMISRRLFGRWRAALITIIGISFYTILVGADAAVVRAAILGGLSILAAQLGRRQAGLNSLAIIAAVMALANPNVLWDLSFQLSFSATLGLVLYADVLSENFNRFAGRWLPQSTLQHITAPVSEYILVTLAAQIVTIPIIIYQSNRISVISLIANPVILPAQPPLMILGGIATIFGMIFLPFGKIISALAWPFALYTIRLVEFFARIPRGEIMLGDTSLLIIVLIYAGLFTITFSGKRVKELLPQIKPGIPLTGLFIFTILIWQLVLALPDSRLHITLLDVSIQARSGHAILIVTPNGRRLLINGGPYSSLLSDALGRRLPWADHELDWLVIGSNSENELAAVSNTFERYPPENVLWSGTTHGNTVARNLWEAFTRAQIPVSIAESGQALDLGDGAQLRILNVSRRGAVLLLEWQNFRALLPLGMDLDYLADSDHGSNVGAVNVLLLAESGYATVNPPEWIKNLDPQLILLSVAADDSQGLPSPETLLAVEGYELLRTDQNGWIELTTDGERMWVEVERR